MRIAVAAVLSLVVLLQTISPAVAAGGVSGSMPSTAANDGKFIGLSGVGNQTYSQPVYIWLGVPQGQTNLTVQVYDGDLGGNWDIHNTANSVLATYTLFDDPTKSGSPTGLTQLVSSDSSKMTDGSPTSNPNTTVGWTTLYNGPVPSSAVAPSGNAFFLLWIQWNNPTFSNTEFNAFKIQANAQVSLASGQVVAFDGGPNNVSTGPGYTGPIDPPVATGTPNPQNTYTGQWDWYIYVPPGSTTISFQDCDADSAVSTTSPGNPPDDGPVGSAFRISPNIQYTISDPNGNLVTLNKVPSGNNVCETLNFPVTTTGLYHWQWNGVDAHNLVFASVQYEMLSAAVTPFPVGTASPTPTRTSTNTPQPSHGGSSSSAPAATWTPTATRTVTPLATTTIMPTTSPTATGTSIVVPKLPATGEAGLPILPIIVLGAALLLVGTSLRKHS